MRIKIKSLLLSVSFFALTVWLGGCASGEGSALESYNRNMYKINRAIDNVTLKPLAKGYHAITPDPVEDSVDNFFSNLGEVSTIINSILQGKLNNAVASSARLVWNTTLGLGGLFDVATAMNIQVDKEDFGQTLRRWGLPAGPYIVLPILGSSTPTDTLGLVGNYFMSPLSYEKLWHNEDTHIGLLVLDRINARVQLFEKEELLKKAAIDEYGFVKSAYLQRRNTLTRDGKGDTEIDQAFDELFEEQ
ncbi:MAG: ABC transporter [Gammaproteobacteria bacterium]|nr:MAG: ABC transporter [Gammaproteobacteria bacterium]